MSRQLHVTFQTFPSQTSNLFNLFFIYTNKCTTHTHKHTHVYTFIYFFHSRTVHLDIIKVFYVPTDAQENCFKKNIKICIKHLLHASVQFCTKTCRKHFNVNFNILFKAIFLCISS